MKLLVIVGTLLLVSFVHEIKCSSRPFKYHLSRMASKKSVGETRGTLMDKGEESDGGGSDQDTKDRKDEDGFISAGPPSMGNNKMGSNNSNKRNDKKSSKDDAVMTDLLHPKKDEKNSTTTMKPFVVVTNPKNNNKQASKKAKPDSGDENESFDDTDFKSSIDKAMEKASSIADNIGDAIKAAINSVASKLKNATDASSPPCTKSSKGARSITPLRVSVVCHLPLGNCTSTQGSADVETTPSTGKLGRPFSSTKRQRRSSEITRWPPKLPLSGLQTQTFSQDSRSDNEDLAENMTISSGGVISQGSVGSSSEESGEEREPMPMGSSKTNTDSGSSNSEGNENGRSSAQNDESEDSFNSSSARNNMTRNMPQGKNNKNMKPASQSQRDVTLTVSGSGSGSGSIGASSSTGVGMGTMGTFGNGVSSSGSMTFQPHYPSRKLGRCRPLTSGLACITLSPDSSQCSSDSGCPGTKKCCFYGCAPYTGVGICEYPVMNM